MLMLVDRSTATCHPFYAAFGKAQACMGCLCRGGLWCRTFVHLAEGAASQQLAQLQAAQQRLLALAQHPRQMLHRARMAGVAPCCSPANHIGKAPCGLRNLRLVRQVYTGCNTRPLQGGWHPRTPNPHPGHHKAAEYLGPSLSIRPLSVVVKGISIISVTCPHSGLLIPSAFGMP